ncbi:hypothetical protein H5410_004504, partial [Solanum commersonii]
ILIQTFSKDISHLFNKQKTIRCYHLLLDLLFNNDNTISGQACGISMDNLDRSWMSLRRCSDKYISGVNDFLDRAFQ